MSGADDIAAERQRQIDAEGWTPEHDDEHWMGEMIDAAIWYADNAAGGDLAADGALPSWPWAAGDWKPSDPRRNLVRAGALIAAEIDRLDRAAPPASPTEETP